MKRKRYIKEEILPFRCVKISIPRKSLIKLFYSHQYISYKKSIKMSRKLREIESAQNKLRHARSIVERIISRRGESR